MGISATPYPSRPKASDIIDSGTLSVTTIAVDHIGQKTTGHGIGVTNELSCNANIVTGGIHYCNHLAENSSGHGIVCDHPLSATLAATAASTAGTNVVETLSNSERVQTGTSVLPVLVLESKWNGTVRLMYQVKSSGAGSGAYVRIYKDGVQVDGQFTTETDFVAKTYDIALVLGTRVTISIYNDTGGQTSTIAANMTVGIAESATAVRLILPAPFNYIGLTDATHLGGLP